MNPADYDAWYDTPRGRWIGETEYRLAARGLAGRPGDSLLDVGCGTGWFTRRAAVDGFLTTGIDPDPVWLAFARRRGADGRWVWGDARELPFGDAAFDHVLSIAALCFVDDARRAAAECVRVAKRRVAVGWLNRASLLYRQKGAHGGSGAYRGARWHTAREIRTLFAGLPVRRLTLRSAAFLPSASAFARGVEYVAPACLPLGAIVLAVADKA